MKILVILRNLYNSKSFFEEEESLCESDCNVLAEAVALKETYNGSVTALLFAEDTDYNEKTLMKAYTYGADQAWHICMDNFDFMDTAAFARAIASAVEKKFPDFDLILFGRLAYDGDAVTIAAMTAQRLGLPGVVYCKETSVSDAAHLCCRKYISASEEVLLRISMPAVVHSIRDQGIRRQARVEDIVRTYSELKVLKIDGAVFAGQEKAGSFADFVCDLELAETGQKKLQILNGVSDEDSAKNLIGILGKIGYRA